MLEFAIGEAVFKIASDCRNTGFNFDKLSSKKTSQFNTWRASPSG